MPPLKVVNWFFFLITIIVKFRDTSYVVKFKIYINSSRTLPTAGKSCGFIDGPEDWFRVVHIAKAYTKKTRNKVI